MYITRTITIRNNTAKIYRDTEWKEFRVKFFRANDYLGEDADYYCDDKDDAVQTATHVLYNMQ